MTGILAILGLVVCLGTAQTIQIDSCCRYTSNIQVENTGVNTLSNGRRVTFFCTLDAADVPNFDFGFIEQGAGRFTLSVYLRSPTTQVFEELWNANRDHLVGVNSTFNFQVGKGLSLLDEAGKRVWAVDMPTAAGFMLDCTVGNLIMFDSVNKTIWESFDHPTDTLLQTQSLEYGMSLVSKKSANDPSTGSYSLVMEAGGLASYDEAKQPYWVLSVTGENNTLGVTTQRCPSSEINRTSAKVFDGFLLLSSCLKTTTVTFRSYTSFNRTRFMKLSERGSLQVYDWNLGTKALDYEFVGSGCALPGYCGKFGVCQNNGQCSCLERFSQQNPSDATGGCVLPEEPTCSTNSAVEMITSDVSSLASEYGYVNRTFPSAEACSSECLNNCSCRVALYNRVSSQCFSYSFQSFIASQGGSKVGYVKVLKARKPSSKTGLILGITIPTVLVSLLGVATFIICRRRRMKSLPNQEDVEEEEEAFLDSLPGLPPRFTLRALEEATDGFNKKLGQGGFGEVYLGKLSNGLQVAVKRLASAHQGKKEFRAEVATIGNIHHVNLVRLRGFCARGSNKLLVYDYMVNGSLDKWLFNTENDIKLDWKTRFNIALGTARGLAYLHESCKERILHLDIKPQNILLDDKFVPKVADFGLAKLLGGEETHVFTTMRGTPGYLAPEWLTSAISEKSDVYSYGIVLLELVSGRHNYQRSADEPLLSFSASTKVQEGRSVEVVEASLREHMDETVKKQAETLVNTALWCVQAGPEIRPSMGNVVLILEGLVEAQKPPPLREDFNEDISKGLVRFIATSSSSSGFQLSSSQITSR